MTTLNNEDKVKFLIENFLIAQKGVCEFIQKNPDRCVQMDQDAELNYSYIGKCGHCYPDYHRIADISLYGDRYQVCGCSKCNGHITFIKYPYKWESSEEIPGVPISLSPVEVYRFLHEEVCSIEYDIDVRPGMFRDIGQHVKMLEIERKKQSQ